MRTIKELLKQAKTSVRSILSHRYRKIYNDDLCWYCGVPFECWDHTIPVSFMINVKDYSNAHNIPLIQSCNECNGLLHNKVFKSLTERKRFVKQRLKNRYRKLLRTPDWTEEELSGLEGNLRRTIISSINERDFVKRRIEYNP